MVIYILTKFGADWYVFVDARVLTRKLWTDGRRTDGQQWMVGDHNSSLSTQYSGELKMLVTSIFSFSHKVLKRPADSGIPIFKTFVLQGHKEFIDDKPSVENDEK